MNQSEREGLLKKFYEGQTSKEEEKLLLCDKNISETDRKTIQSESNFYDQLKSVSMTEPFSIQEITETASKNSFTISTGLKFAASVIISVGIYWGGYFSFAWINKPQEKISSLEVELLQSRISLIEETLSQQSNLSHRKGMAMISEANYIDEKIVDQLLSILNSSQSVNLRLMALDILSGHINNSTVSDKIFSSITHQTSELVLSELARIAIIMRNKEAGNAILKQMELISDSTSIEFPLKRELEILI